LGSAALWRLRLRVAHQRQEMRKLEVGDKGWFITSGENLRINMGAYGGTTEASMPPYDWALLSDVTNDGIVDFVDFAHLADIYTDQDDELPADFDRDGDVDYGDLHLLTEDWLKETIWPH